MIEQIIENAKKKELLLAQKRKSIRYKKILGRSEVLRRDGDDLILEGPRGQIWREKHAYF